MVILPATACRRLGHRIDERNKQPGPGKYEVCVVCTLGYEMAMIALGGDEEQADEFVREIRRS